MKEWDVQIFGEKLQILQVLKKVDSENDWKICLDINDNIMPKVPSSIKSDYSTRDKRI